MEYLWAWALLLLALGMGLAILEVFFPSGGILGFLSGSSIVAAIVVAFKQGSTFGMGIVLGALVGLPVVAVAALRVWPKTSIGRRMLLKTPAGDKLLPDSPKRRLLKSLVGHVGEARSKMLPSGAITIDGHTIDAVSEGMAIEVGQRVRVIEVEGNRVMVRPLDDETPSDDQADPLSRPIESVGPDPFPDEPA